tara:strand:+ start:2166 stop:2330 length:165 start_codon:yes stop_codon:yes gene_type:complete
MIYNMDIFDLFILDEEEDHWRPEPLYLEDLEPDYYNHRPPTDEKDNKRVIIIDI